VIALSSVTKIYRRGATQVRALSLDTLQVPRGQFLSVMGPSGSGKSTLLNLLGALDAPTSGAVTIDGRDIARLSDDALSEFRRERLGFVFQFFNLLPTLTALENVLLPGLLAGRARAELEPRAGELLEAFGLGARSDHRPDELSGGEMQRVAVARALVLSPALVLADEPTGNLDSRTGSEVLRLLREATRARNVTVVMVTHDAKAAGVGDRIVRLADGVLVGDEQVPQPPAGSGAPP
jgi:putative ABC transport system ATP-binding protein